MAEGTGTKMDEALHRLAQTGTILVACDYDGTLSPIVSDPASASPDPESIEALLKLAALPGVHVAIVSGRALKQLAELVGRHEFHMVGSHGSEFGPQFEQMLPPEARALRDLVADDLAQIASKATGLHIEIKPASVAFHYRNAEDGDAQHALREILAGPSKRPGVLTHHGKRVVELAVVEASKGHALDVLRQELSPAPGAVFFIGDDVTDENGFAALRSGDVGVKVGDGSTRAEYRVGDTGDVAVLLRRLGHLRTATMQPGAPG